jgi:Na+/H+ antiporter NhaD/arsenite permease-like protein
MKKHRKAISYVIAVAMFLLFFFNAFHEVIRRMEILPVSPIAVVPFALMLLSIAILPFINRHWWEKNYPAVSFTLGVIVILYYVLTVENVPRLLATFEEYISFICLIGSLFVVSGGILIRMRGKASPLNNIALLGSGAVISNFLGTTGASMLLLRPYIRMNKYRIKGYHIVFFIFIVSNIGGALTPIGDPPLFLGYLKGIPFFWIFGKAFFIWVPVIVGLLAIFFVIDSLQFHKYPKTLQHEAETDHHEPRVDGTINILFLFIILAAVFIPPQPAMVREVVMCLAALGSYILTDREIHKKNDFNFVPIKEVAILFAGIFVTMIPALDWLSLNSRELGIVTPGQYFWFTGLLSSFLDNAPTYLNFLAAAFGIHGASIENPIHMNLILALTTPETVGLSNPLNPAAIAITINVWQYVQAVSLGAVFFGACTYIGNGPNFMVKTIAEQTGVEMPSFLGYIVKYSIPILLPVFFLVWFFAFR